MYRTAKKPNNCQKLAWHERVDNSRATFSFNAHSTGGGLGRVLGTDIKDECTALTGK